MRLIALSVVALILGSTLTVVAHRAFNRRLALTIEGTIYDIQRKCETAQGRCDYIVELTNGDTVQLDYSDPAEADLRHLMTKGSSVSKAEGDLVATIDGTVHEWKSKGSMRVMRAAGMAFGFAGAAGLVVTLRGLRRRRQ